MLTSPQKRERLPFKTFFGRPSFYVTRKKTWLE